MNKKPKPEFYRRTLPDTCISFSSDFGKQIFRESLQSGYLDSYFSLASQFCTQDEPAYCGLSTLVMALNTLEIDPHRVWKGPWRWYHESMLDCCVPLKEIQKTGITVKEFVCLAQCNGLNTKLVQVTNQTSINEFRSIVQDICQNQQNRVLAVSYSRATLKQTGTGHFSTIAGYHDQKDLVLILDTARFKYPPHWVKLPLIFEAMQALDPDTGEPRGYIVLEKEFESNSLNLYRLSSYFNITSSIDNYSSKKFMDSWINWLNNPRNSTVADMKSFICTAIDALVEAIATIDDGQFLLDTRVTKCVSSEQRCLIKQAIQSLKDSELYSFVIGQVTESPIKCNISNKLCMCCQSCTCCTSMKKTTPTRDSGDCCSNNITLWMSCDIYITTLLLSWPYGTKDDTNGVHLKDYVEKIMEQIDQPLNNEVKKLRQQFAAISEFSEYMQVKRN